MGLRAGNLCPLSPYAKIPLLRQIDSDEESITQRRKAAKNRAARRSPFPPSPLGRRVGSEGSDVGACPRPKRFSRRRCEASSRARLRTQHSPLFHYLIRFRKPSRHLFQIARSGSSQPHAAW